MSKAQRFVIVTDTHGDKLDKDASRVFWDWLGDWRPQIRIHLGDAFDFRAFRRGASDEERRDNLRADIDAGCTFIRKLKPTVFCRGNHDERLWDVTKGDDKRLAGLCGMLVDDIADAIGEHCQMLPYDTREGVYKLGQWSCLHGYYHGVNAARQSALAWGNCIVGHGHGIDSVNILGPKPRTGMMIGCLTTLRQDYNRAQPGALRHEHGWAYGVLNGDNTATVIQARMTGDRWILPSEVKTYA